MQAVLLGKVSLGSDAQGMRMTRADIGDDGSYKRCMGPCIAADGGQFDSFFRLIEQSRSLKLPYKVWRGWTKRD